LTNILLGRGKMNKTFSCDEPVSLEKRTVLVTGGSGGIGRGIVESLVKASARVVILCHQNCESAQKWISKSLMSSSIKLWQIDISALRCVTDIELPTGIDAVIHCAGTPSLSPLLRCTYEELWFQYHIHVIGPLILTQRLLLQEKVQLKDVIFIASIAGLDLKSGIYALTKAGTVALSKILAMELRHKGVRVNTIAPGWTETEMAEFVLSRQGSSIEALKKTRLDGTLVSAKEIGMLCVDLLSNKYPHLQGQVLILESW